MVYTTDVHCGISDNIGYVTLAAYTNYLKQKNVTLVDAGDANQGAMVGSLSKGKYIIDLVNEVVSSNAMLDSEALTSYIVDVLKGKIRDKYLDFEKRVIVD